MQRVLSFLSEHDVCETIWHWKTWKVQKRATKMLPGLRKMPYRERLKELELPTLIYRRSRGDIETYKLLSWKYDSQVALKLPLYLSDDHHTRGNSRKLLVQRCHYELTRVCNNNKLQEMRTQRHFACVHSRRWWWWWWRLAFCRLFSVYRQMASNVTQ